MKHAVYVGQVVPLEAQFNSIHTHYVFEWLALNMVPFPCDLKAQLCPTLISCYYQYSMEVRLYTYEALLAEKYYHEEYCM